jgi:tRNA U34 5-methylaminomethyl-2-thiouridine-forming methyltransferase MnmC
MHTANPYPCVLVEWEDSAQPSSAWSWVDELSDSVPVLCQTVGFLVKETERCLVLALSIGDATSERPQANGVMQIPRSAVVHLTSLAPCGRVHVA